MFASLMFIPNPLFQYYSKLIEISKYTMYVTIGYYLCCRTLILGRARY